MSESETTTAVATERAVPYHCPYCADENLHPDAESPGAWHCGSCLRTFSVRFLGIKSADSGRVAPLTGVPA